MLNTTTKDLGSNTTTEELIDFTASPSSLSIGITPQNIPSYYDGWAYSSDNVHYKTSYNSNSATEQFTTAGLQSIYVRGFRVIDGEEILADIFKKEDVTLSSPSTPVGLIESTANFSNLGDTWVSDKHLTSPNEYSDDQSNITGVDWVWIEEVSSTTDPRMPTQLFSPETHALAIRTNSGSTNRHAVLFMLDQTNTITLPEHLTGAFSFKFFYRDQNHGPTDSTRDISRDPSGGGMAVYLVANQGENYYARSLKTTGETEGIFVHGDSIDRVNLMSGWLRVNGPGCLAGGLCDTSPLPEEDTSFGLCFANAFSGKVRMWVTDIKIEIFDGNA